MELRQMIYALKVAEEKNFSKAAEKLHIAQPSLSQQIAKLERELGVRLFERGKNSVHLTYAGERFVEKAAKILDMTEELKKEMMDVADMRKGKLIIGSLPITGSHLLPLVLPVFKERYPGIDIVLVEETTLNLESLTARGETDLTLLTLPIQEANLEWVPVIDEEICLAVPPEHPLADEKAVPLSKLKNDPFISLKKGQGFRHIVLQLCELAGFVPNIVFESSNIETVQSLVAAGMGVALVPAMIKRNQPQPFVPVYLTVSEPKAQRTLVLAYRKGRYLSKAAHAFIDTMITTVKRHPDAALA
ncbi:LysR family transcriptional regulator [Bacillaceae bacterium]